jgi:hypothetical protein
VNKAILLALFKVFLALISVFSPTKIDVWLNGQALFDPVFKWCLSDLKMNLSDKSYSKDNRLNRHYSSH